MTEDDRTIIADFEEKLYSLVLEYKKKDEQNRKLSTDIREKENMLKELQMRCNALERSYNDLKQARIMSLNDAAVGETKERISKLVREIDRCIEALKK